MTKVLYKNFMKNKFFRDSIIILLGTVFVRGISFITSIIFARSLGTEEFGNFNLIQSNMTMLITLIDIGLSTGFIKYAAIYIEKEPNKAAALLKITLKIKIILSLVIVILGFIFSRSICLIIFRDEELIGMFRISLIGVLAETLYGYSNYILRAYEKFKVFAISGIIYSVIQVFLIINIFIIGTSTSEMAMLAIVITPILACIYNMKVVPKKLLRRKYSKDERSEVFKELFGFTKWILISTLCNLMISRVDIFMLKYYMTEFELGLYAGAQKVSMIFPILVTTITTILLPKVSKYSTTDEYNNLVKKSLVFGISMIPILIILTSSSNFLIRNILGEEFIRAVPILNLLLISYIFAIFVNPISLILYNLNKEYILAIINFVQLIINCIGNYLLIKEIGVVGVAMSTTIVNVVGCISIILIVLINIKKMNKTNCNSSISK